MTMSKYLIIPVTLVTLLAVGCSSANSRIRYNSPPNPNKSGEEDIITLNDPIEHHEWKPYKIGERDTLWIRPLSDSNGERSEAKYDRKSQADNFHFVFASRGYNLNTADYNGNPLEDDSDPFRAAQAVLDDCVSKIQSAEADSVNSLTRAVLGNTKTSQIGTDSTRIKNNDYVGPIDRFINWVTNLF